MDTQRLLGWNPVRCGVRYVMLTDKYRTLHPPLSETQNFCCFLTQKTR